MLVYNPSGNLWFVMRRDSDVAKETSTLFNQATLLAPFYHACACSGVAYVPSSSSSKDGLLVDNHVSQQVCYLLAESALALETLVFPPEWSIIGERLAISDVVELTSHSSMMYRTISQEYKGLPSFADYIQMPREAKKEFLVHIVPHMDTKSAASSTKRA
jgi:hypothetical protein